MARERTVPEIISLLAQFVDRGQSQIEYKNPENQKELRMLLEMIENADRQEVEEVKEKMNSPELEQQCEKIYQDAEKAKKALSNEDFDKVRGFLEEILDLEKNLYGKIQAYDLEKEFQKGEFIGDGRNARVYELENHDGLVIKILKEDGFTDPDSVVARFKRYQKVEEQLPDEVQVARIRKAGYYEGHAAVVMDRAPGREVHWEPDSVKGEVDREEWYEHWSNMNEVMADAPQRHYNRLSRDVEILRKHNIKVDPKSDNILFHSEKGFTILDLAKDDVACGTGKKGRYRPDILETLVRTWLADKFEDLLTAEDVQNMLKIEEKVDNAGNPASKKQALQNTKNKMRKLESEFLG
ncbi:MAG: hypothetical protein ABEJ03_03770 [Candidatus Nanohaloarchaea archaeon]